VIHETAHITAAQREELRRRLAARARELSREIESALERMGRGSYGVCVDCGAAIPWVRLQALPEAARCAHCEAAREHRAGAS